MKLKEFLEQNNTILNSELEKCKTVEELEAFAKANDVELTQEELESIRLKFEGKNVLLSDDELDSVAGGHIPRPKPKHKPNLFGTSACPGPKRFNDGCYKCNQLVAFPAGEGSYMAGMFKQFACGYIQ